MSFTSGVLLAKSKPHLAEAASSISRICPLKSAFNSSGSPLPKRFLQADGFGWSDTRASVRSSVGLPFESRTSDIFSPRRKKNPVSQKSRERPVFTKEKTPKRLKKKQRQLYLPLAERRFRWTELCSAGAALQTVRTTLSKSRAMSSLIIQNTSAQKSELLLLSMSCRAERNCRQSFSVPNMAIERCTWDWEGSLTLGVGDEEETIDTQSYLNVNEGRSLAKQT